MGKVQILLGESGTGIPPFSRRQAAKVHVLLCRLEQAEAARWGGGISAVAALLIGSTRMRYACCSHACSCRLFTLTVLAFVELASTVEWLNVRIAFNSSADGLVAVGSVGAVDTICALLGVPCYWHAQWLSYNRLLRRTLASSAASRIICSCAIRRGSRRCC
eukprot:3695685-Pleurochrysis_carterae.AAC.2